nr:putative retrotransposon Ty1-copia subclass protein [Tanacetum cinerariifolium]
MPTRILKTKHLNPVSKPEFKPLVEGLIGNQRFNDSLLAVQLGKMERESYDSLPVGPMLKAILKKKITQKEDIGGIAEDVFFEIAGFVYLKETMKSEIQSMYDNQVWNMVDTTPGLKMVGCKWIFKKKTDMDEKVHTYKARTSGRVRKPPQFYYGFHIEEEKISDSTLSELDEPANYKEAMASPEATK